MSHHIPPKLKGEERYFTIPYVNIHFNKKGIFYNGGVTALSAIIGKATNSWVFIVLLIGSNLIAYPLAHGTVFNGKFEGGGVPLDIYFIRKLRYHFFGRNRYTRRRGD